MERERVGRQRGVVLGWSRGWPDVGEAVVVAVGGRR